MNRQGYLIAFLGGIIFVLVVLFFLRNDTNYAYAQTADSGTGAALIIGTGGIIQQQNDILWVIYKRKPAGKEVNLVRKEFIDLERITLATYKIEQPSRLRHLVPFQVIQVPFQPR